MKETSYKPGNGKKCGGAPKLFVVGKASTYVGREVALGGRQLMGGGGGELGSLTTTKEGSFVFPRGVSREKRKTCIVKETRRGGAVIKKRSLKEGLFR